MAIPQPSSKGNEICKSEMKEMLVGASMFLGALIALGSVFGLVSIPFLGHFELMGLQVVAAAVILLLYWSDIRNGYCLIRVGLAAGNLAAYAATALVLVLIKTILILPN